RTVKDLFLTLDKQFNPTVEPIEQFASKILPQLKSDSPVILNGNPLLGKPNFQQQWVHFPVTQHTVTSIDYHVVPGTNIVIINLSGKVKFDENGYTKMGQSADIPPKNSAGGNRPIWGSANGFNAQMVIDDSGLVNLQSEFINSFNWKVVFSPSDSMVKV
ncbi:hypothetical protein WICPIJ_009345, partial [Wickerhamomyces pijperi]